jgi:transcriptional regulator with XRE-family HTH domain
MQKRKALREWRRKDMETLREYRKTKGLTQRQLANRIGVSHVTVGNWENGYSRIPNGMIEKIKALQFTNEELSPKWYRQDWAIAFRAWRRRNHLSQAEAGQWFGVARITVAKWEQGVGNIPQPEFLPPDHVVARG